MRFTDEALEDAKGRATKEAAPLLAGVTLDTPVGQLPYFKGTGCDACADTGLKGRQGLYEVMTMSPRLRRQVLTSSDAARLRDLAIEEGMLTLRMDGWLKVLKGITTLEQIVRETGV
jgi:type IV pilus assembly protein PilB